MKQPIVIIGIGELAGVLARAFLRYGHPVYPITRSMIIAEESDRLPDPKMAVVAVAEKDYPAVMETMPEQWRDRLVLIQNELLPRDWETYGVPNPTVLSVWFEKKKGMDYNPILPSPIYGPMADLIAQSLEQIDIPCKILTGRDDLVSELALKNVFVFTINIAGLVLAEGTTTSMLWEKDRELALAVADDIIDLQESITGKTFSRDRLKEGLFAGLKGDPHHKCKGRSAHGRLVRAIKLADELDLKIQTIRDVQRRCEDRGN
jgi:hypothetical protein